MFSSKAISLSSPYPKLAFRLRDETRGREGFISKTKWNKGWRQGFESIEQNRRRCYSVFHYTKVSAAATYPKHIKSTHPFKKRIPIKQSLNAVSEHKFAPEPEADSSNDLFFLVLKQLDAFYRFCRPHTIIGTIVGISSVSLLPVESAADLSPVFFKGLLQALLPALFMNIYVVGLNQLFDVEIDKVNKPNLPIASGEFSMKKGIFIVTTFAIMSFALGLSSRSPPLLSALLIAFVLGSAYSINLPFLRWKQHAVLAASCILCSRAILVQLAFFLHMKVYVLGRPAVFTKTVIFATAFMCCFSAVISLFKDIPDIDGDRDFGIQTFSVRLGSKTVFWLCIKILLTAYAAAMLLGLTSPNLTQKLVTVLGHGLLAALLWSRALSVDVQNKAVVTSFYMLIWKLFYAEYFLIPFMH